MASRSQEEQSLRRPFLETGHQGNQSAQIRTEEERRFEKSSRAKPFYSRRLNPAAFHILLVSIYSSIFIIALRFSTRSLPSCAQIGYSPAQSSIEYTRKRVDGLESDSIYAGPPNPESDEAWHNLLANINLRITPEEMKSLNQTSLALADGSGYLGTLGVYHELHCIKRIRKFVYKDYYYPNSSYADEMEHLTHAAHCIELLRQASICKGDTSVTGFKWLNGKFEPTTIDGVLHSCVNWERLSGWAGERAVDLFDPDLLSKPTAS